MSLTEQEKLMSKDIFKNFIEACRSGKCIVYKHLLSIQGMEQWPMLFKFVMLDRMQI